MKTTLSWPPDEQLTRFLGKVYDHYQKLPDRAANAKRRHDFVFHMTDWLTDLRHLVDTYQQPTKTGTEAVYAFLIHALPHLMEAGRLLEGREIRNPFIDN